MNEMTYTMSLLSNLRWTFTMLMILSIPLAGLFGVSSLMFMSSADPEEPVDRNLKLVKRLFIIFLVVFIISTIGQTVIPDDWDMQHIEFFKALQVGLYNKYVIE